MHMNIGALDTVKCLVSWFDHSNIPIQYAGYPTQQSERSFPALTSLYEVLYSEEPLELLPQSHFLPCIMVVSK